MIFIWNSSGIFNLGVINLILKSLIINRHKFTVPLVSRILPSDICKIYKSGANIRLDTTLVDFSDMRWERGDISFMFNGNAQPNESLTVLDNIMKVYQRVRYEVSIKHFLLKNDRNIKIMAKLQN